MLPPSAINLGSIMAAIEMQLCVDSGVELIIAWMDCVCELTTSRSVLPHEVIDRISSVLRALCSCSSRHSALPNMPCYELYVSPVVGLKRICPLALQTGRV